MNTDYGQCFEAPCGNDLEMDEYPYSYICGGTLHFGEFDTEAPCDRCGARCGRLVAFRHLAAGPDVEVLQILPMPEPVPLREFLDEVSRQVMQQVGVPEGMLQTFSERGGWMSAESKFWQRNEGARE
jgi:hypothetical protein